MNYNIINYDEFENSKDILSSNIGCTVLKVQEKKTQKGTSYGIVKFSDLSNVFELFIFSEIFENNRNLLNEGNSLMLTLMKTYSDENRNQKRINIKKIVSLNDLVNPLTRLSASPIATIHEPNTFLSWLTILWQSLYKYPFL